MIFGQQSNTFVFAILSYLLDEAIQWIILENIYGNSFLQGMPYDFRFSFLSIRSSVVVC